MPLPGFRLFAGNLWLIHASPCSLSAFPWHVTKTLSLPMPVSVSKFPLFMRTLVELDWGPFYLPCFNLITSTETPISKQGHICSTGSSGFNITFGAGHNLTYNGRSALSRKGRVSPTLICIRLTRAQVLKLHSLAARAA